MSAAVLAKYCAAVPALCASIENVHVTAASGSRMRRSEELEGSSGTEAVISFNSDVAVSPDAPALAEVSIVVGGTLIEAAAPEGTLRIISADNYQAPSVSPSSSAPSPSPTTLEPTVANSNYGPGNPPPTARPTNPPNAAVLPVLPGHYSLFRSDEVCTRHGGQDASGRRLTGRAQDFNECLTGCDGNADCAFVTFTVRGYCRYFSSCDDRRAKSGAVVLSRDADVQTTPAAPSEGVGDDFAIYRRNQLCDRSSEQQNTNSLMEGNKWVTDIFRIVTRSRSS